VQHDLIKALESGELDLSNYLGILTATVCRIEDRLETLEDQIKGVKDKEDPFPKMIDYKTPE
jgi:hypothetical protein